MTDEANELLELIIAYAQAYSDWDGSEYSSAELYEEICKAVEELDKSGQNKMKKQDKIFCLLKWHGWERAETPEGVGYHRFRQVDRKKEMAYNDCQRALGWCDALEITCARVYVQKEGDVYAGYLEF